jgi:hypothetical protein
MSDESGEGICGACVDKYERKWMQVLKTGITKMTHLSVGSRRTATPFTGLVFPNLHLMHVVSYVSKCFHHQMLVDKSCGQVPRPVLKGAVWLPV